MEKSVRSRSLQKNIIVRTEIIAKISDNNRKNSAIDNKIVMLRIILVTIR